MITRRRPNPRPAIHADFLVCSTRFSQTGQFTVKTCFFFLFDPPGPLPSSSHPVPGGGSIQETDAATPSSRLNFQFTPHVCPPKSPRALLIEELAWASTDTPAWFRIWALVISEVSSARSASRIRLLAAIMFSLFTVRLLITD